MRNLKKDLGGLESIQPSSFFVHVYQKTVSLKKRVFLVCSATTSPLGRDRTHTDNWANPPPPTDIQGERLQELVEIERRCEPFKRGYKSFFLEDFLSFASARIAMTVALCFLARRPLHAACQHRIQAKKKIKTR